MRPSSALRSLLRGPYIVKSVGAANSMDARLAALAGFPVVVVPGSVVTNTLLGLPDSGFLTLTEMELVVSRMSAAVPIPAVVDCANGYGGTANVRHTVRTIERAGAAGLFLDNLAGSFGQSDSSLVPASTFVDKISAAADGRTDPDVLIIAVTFLLPGHGIDAAIECANRCAEAGADMSLIGPLKTREEYERVGREVSGLKLANPNLGANLGVGALSGLGISNLQHMGFQMINYGGVPLRAAALSTFEFLVDLAQSGPDAVERLRERLRGTPFEHWSDFTRSD